MGRYVDLHSHFLPALDDGAKDLPMSLEMVSALASLGFEVLTATPHQRANKFMPTRTDIDSAYKTVGHEVAGAFPQLQLGLAAENFWDDVFRQRLMEGGLPCYPSGKSFLFEFDPRLMPPMIEQQLFQIRLSRRLPVMAHPERYVEVQNDIGRAEVLGRTAALVVDLGALDGAHGRAEKKTARKLMESGFVHAVTSDIHTAEDQRSIAAGMAWITKRLGPGSLDRLLDENPRRILAGELP